MKKIFTFLTIMLFVFAAHAQQVDRNLVLLEITTGTWCPSCPSAAHTADYLHENGYPVAIIENHGPMNYGDPFANVSSVARNTYYSNNLYPTGQFDGNWGEVEGGNQYSYISKVNQRIVIPTSFEIEMDGLVTGNDYDMTISVTKVDDYPGSNLKVRFALTESHIPYNWQGENELNHLMVPDANGTAVNFSSVGETIEVPLSFTFDDSWDIENCELVVFLQDDGNKEVLNSFKMDPQDVSSFSVEVTATPDEICIGESSQLNAETTGGSGTFIYSWSSNPEGFISDEQNPEVSPTETTIYYVEVDDGEQKAYAEAEITVNDLPMIIMVNWPEQLCNQQEPPVQLNTLPSGGTYSGNNVTPEGIFSPEEAPLGWNVISYTYQDNDGCVNSESDSIFVDQCVGINNAFDSEASLVVFPNPNSGSFNINSSQTIQKVELINQIGQIVYTETIGLNDVKINTNIERGIYFIKVSLLNNKDETKIVYKKILIN